MSTKLPSRGKAASSSGSQSSKQGDKDALGSILTFSERSDLVMLIEAIASDEIKKISSAFDVWQPDKADQAETDSDAATAEDAKDEHAQVSEPEIQALRASTLKWYEKWRTAVLRRVCEAANTRWEPMGGSDGDGGGAKDDDAPPKSWDELSWDDEDPKEKLKEDGGHTAGPADELLQSLYPPISTPLRGQPRDKRLLVLHSTLLILLSLKHYHAPSRQLLQRLAASLDLTLADVDADEERTAQQLVSGAKALTAQEEVKQRANQNQSLRSWKVLGASIAGAAVIGLTGGLAAPLVAAGVGTVLGGLGLGATAAAGLLGSLAGSSVLVGGLFGAYGARMTGKMVDQYAQEISDFAFVPLRGDAAAAGEGDEDDVERVNADDRRLRVVVGVSGWLTEPADVDQPWRVLGSRAEAFALRWELECLSQLGTGLREMVTSAAWNFARMQVLKLTVFSTLIGAVALPLGLLKLGSLVDNPFRVAKTRADKAGEVLADALISRAQGERPVVLMGYSLGARLIYECLLCLARRRAFGLVESVVLLGAPTPSDAAAWRMARAVVAGRVVNVFSANDNVLGFLYRASSAQVGVAGLQAIKVPGVENKDVGDVVTSHFHYRYLVGRVLRELGWEDFDGGELERQGQQFRQLLEQERKIAEIIDEKGGDDEEKKRLIEEMDTKAPVERRPASASPPAEERPPALPPRRGTSQSSGLSLGGQERDRAEGRAGPRAEKEAPERQEAEMREGAEKQAPEAVTKQPEPSPAKAEQAVQTHEDNDSEHETHSGIQMVDND